MSSSTHKDERCRYCTAFLRTKSTPTPENKQGVRRLGPKAAQHADAALAALNSQQAVLNAALNSNQPALSFEDPVFTNRLHYRDGKSCHDVVSKELKELPAPVPSADAEPAGQPEPVVRQPARLPRRTELEQLQAGAGELSLDALLDGGTMSVGGDRRRVKARTPMPAAAGGDAGEEAMDVDAIDLGELGEAMNLDPQTNTWQPPVADSAATEGPDFYTPAVPEKSARALQMAATRARLSKSTHRCPSFVWSARAPGCSTRSPPAASLPPPPPSLTAGERGERPRSARRQRCSSGSARATRGPTIS